MRIAILQCLLLTAPVAAQKVWLVADNTSVDAVIAQAVPGDTVQLATTHPPFLVNKGVHVVGAPGGTTIVFLQPPSFPGPGSIAVAVPAGQRASLRGVRVSDMTFFGTTEGTLELRSGQCEVSDCSVAGPIVVRAGNHVLQRITSPAGTWLDLQGGICSVADSSFHPQVRWGYQAPYGRVGISQTGGVLIASRVSVTGTTSLGSNGPAEPAMQVYAGTAYLTDCTLRGGDIGFYFPPAATALVGRQFVHLARTTLIDGLGAAPSSGYSVEPSMVGMSCEGTPTLGASFPAAAIAGNSQQMLGILGGFDATPSNAVPFVEPLFGSPANLTPLQIHFPAPGEKISTTVNVPNVLSLRGAGFWLQAVQIDGSAIRASALVGGTIR